jgi:hypothetical protein
MVQRGGRRPKPHWNSGAALCLRLGRVATVVFMLSQAAVSPVAAQQTGQSAGSARATIAFDIPAQPLSDALYSFSAVTGIEVLVPVELVARRQATGVSGVLNPQDALSALLSGTGLVARYTGPSAFTLVPAISDAGPTVARIPRFPEYSAALQAAVTRALCRLRETRPGGYRVAARLWVGPLGKVERVGVLGTTGDADRDAALADLLGHLVIGEAPPAGLAQPTTLVVLPRKSASVDCQARDAGVAP